MTTRPNKGKDKGMTVKLIIECNGCAGTMDESTPRFRLTNYDPQEVLNNPFSDDDDETLDFCSEKCVHDWACGKVIQQKAAEARVGFDPGAPIFVSIDNMREAYDSGLTIPEFLRRMAAQR